MSALLHRLFHDRQRAYAILANVMGQLSTCGVIYWTPSEIEKWVCYSYFVPYNLLIFWYLKTGNLRRYTLWCGGLGLLYVFVLTWLEGGILSSSAGWFLVLSIAFHYLLGARWGMLATAMSTVLLVFLAWANHVGWVLDPLVNVLQSRMLSTMSLSDYLSVSLLVFVIPWMYEKAMRERIHTINQRKQALEIKQKELEHTVALRDQFIASVSHELRTPMNAILGLNQVLLERVKDKPEAQRVLKYTQQSADHLMTVINDVLDYSQFSSGEISAHKERFFLREVVQAAYELFVPRAQSVGLDYRCEVGEDVPNWVVSDRHRLMQILVNLLGNAMKFTERGAVVLEVKRSPENPASMAGIEFGVKDSGIGIASENLEKIFERFTQEDEQTQSRFGGTGLGLTISRKLVAILGGELRVSSRLGEGSRFWFVLPLAEAHVVAEPMPVGQALPSHTPSQRVRFLVVDDQAINRKLVKLILTQHCNDCFIAEASNGEEALTRLAQEPFDMVIMDMVMPRVDGIDAARRIRVHDLPQVRQIPVLGLTANVTQNDLARFKQAGVNEIMLKPLQVDRLLHIIQRLLNRTH